MTATTLTTIATSNATSNARPAAVSDSKMTSWSRRRHGRRAAASALTVTTRWTRRRAGPRGSARPSLVRALQSGDVDLLHLQHGSHDALGLGGILVAQHLRQDGRDDLPRHAEPVLEPPALHFLAAGGELR